MRSKMSPTHDHQNNLDISTADPIKKKSSFSQEDADHPPDSYSIPIHAELDWFVRNAFFQRNYSAKASNASASNSSVVPKQLRKSDSSIIWIPKTQRRSSLPETKFRRAPPPIRLVSRRSDVVGIGSCGGGVEAEPSSPKVSCTGRVRQKKNKPAKKSKKKTPSRPETPRKSTSVKLWTRLRDVFRSGKLKDESQEAEAPAMRWRTKRSKSSRVQQSSPVPGSLTRFASGRKSDSWIMQMKTAVEEVDDDTGRFDRRGIGLWSRRNMEAPEPLDCGRDWLDSGPASV